MGILRDLIHLNNINTGDKKGIAYNDIKVFFLGNKTQKSAINFRTWKKRTRTHIKFFF